MRFETTPAFSADWARLTPGERQMFRAVVRDFSATCDRFVEDPSSSWPGTLRVKKIENAKGVFEMTWSFSGPDGRATWEWTTVETIENGRTVRHPAVRWRRIGTHRIFNSP